MSFGFTERFFAVDGVFVTFVFTRFVLRENLDSSRFCDREMTEGGFEVSGVDCSGVLEGLMGF
jgi:hypothetical protein